jgi:hypothetical protein
LIFSFVAVASVAALVDNMAAGSAREGRAAARGGAGVGEKGARCGATNEWFARAAAAGVATPVLIGGT